MNAILKCLQPHLTFLSQTKVNFSLQIIYGVVSPKRKQGASEVAERRGHGDTASWNFNSDVSFVIEVAHVGCRRAEATENNPTPHCLAECVCVFAFTYVCLCFSMLCGADIWLYMDSELTIHSLFYLEQKGLQRTQKEEFKSRGAVRSLGLDTWNNQCTLVQQTPLQYSCLHRTAGRKLAHEIGRASCRERV